MGKIKGWEKISEDNYLKGYNSIFLVSRGYKKVRWHEGDEYAVVISNPMNEVAKHFRTKKEARAFMSRWRRSH